MWLLVVTERRVCVVGKQEQGKHPLRLLGSSALAGAALSWFQCFGCLLVYFFLTCPQLSADLHRGLQLSDCLCSQRAASLPAWQWQHLPNSGSSGAPQGLIFGASWQHTQQVSSFQSLWQCCCGQRSCPAPGARYRWPHPRPFSASPRVCCQPARGAALALGFRGFLALELI